MTSLNQDLLKRLQHMQRLVERACAERDLAYTEAAQWKQRYETEAHQRQLERSQVDSTQVHESGEHEPLSENDDLAALKIELAQLRLALDQEKESHQKTRASLITALGDALQRKPN